MVGVLCDQPSVVGALISDQRAARPAVAGENRSQPLGIFGVHASELPRRLWIRTHHERIELTHRQPAGPLVFRCHVGERRGQLVIHHLLDAGRPVGDVVDEML